MAAPNGAARSRVGQQITATCQICERQFTYIKGAGRLRKKCRRDDCGAPSRRVLVDRSVTCAGCGIVFQRGRSQQTYCTRECAFEKRRRESAPLHPPSCVVHFLDCDWCERPFTSNRPRATCSKACEKGRNARRFQINTRKKNKPCECRECGALFTPITGARDFCSEPCSTAWGRRIHKRVRRARMRTNGRIEKVDSVVVHERCGWRCQACGCDTPRELMGTLDDNAPEADHIVALAKGGEHTYENHQTLCLVCNRLKSDEDFDVFLDGCIGGVHAQSSGASAA